MYGNYEAIFISVLMNCMQSLRQSWYFASVITCLGCNAYHWDVHGLSSCDTNMAIHYKVILMFECVSIENEKWIFTHVSEIREWWYLVKIPITDRCIILAVCRLSEVKLNPLSKCSFYIWSLLQIYKVTLCASN